MLFDSDIPKKIDMRLTGSRPGGKITLLALILVIVGHQITVHSRSYLLIIFMILKRIIDFRISLN